MLRSVDIFISFCIWNLKQWIFVAIIILLCRLLNNSKFLPILIFIYFCHGTKMNFTLIWKKLKISVIVLHLILFRTLDVFDRFYLATNEYQYKIFYGCFPKNWSILLVFFTPSSFMNICCEPYFHIQWKWFLTALQFY